MLHLFFGGIRRASIQIIWSVLTLPTCEHVAHIVHVFGPHFHVIDFQNLVSLVQLPGLLGSAALHDAPDDHRPSLVSDGGSLQVMEINATPCDSVISKILKQIALKK